MRDYSTLTDADINTKLAEKMGRLVVHICGELLMQKTEIEFEPWSPCTSRDDLAVVVEWIEENNREVTPALHAALLLHADRGFQYSTLWLLTCQPRIIAEACLEVLEG